MPAREQLDAAMTRKQLILIHAAALALALAGLLLWDIYGVPIALMSAFLLC